MTTALKKLPIGIDDFEMVIQNDHYYVDKSLFIKELLENGALVTLLPRPRRFGKTLNMSMLNYFFEKNTDSKMHLFDNLAISKDASSMAHQGQYPVIFLTFKFTGSNNWDDCFEKIKQLIAKEYKKHSQLLQTQVLNGAEARTYQSIIDGTADNVGYELSLKNLTEYLDRYHQKKVIVLIDEYDVPINAGYRLGYYNQIVSFTKSFIGEGLKGNVHLFKGVMTGALRVTRESVFTGMNNLFVCTFLNQHYADKFGLLQHEVATMLQYYGLDTDLEHIQAWYNGYRSGLHKVYNPWSILNLVANHGEVAPYWINTSNNDLIIQLIQNSDTSVKKDMEQLLMKKVITKPLNENISFAEVKNNTDSLWNFLLFSGYLTYDNKRLINRQVSADLLIPNEEVMSFYESTIMSWFGPTGAEHSYSQMLARLLVGDIETFSELFADCIATSFSYFDLASNNPERFYHAFVLGMLISLSDQYSVKSNRESGYGRYDVMIIPKDQQKLGIILEFKKVSIRRQETLELAADSALQQIRDKKYATEMAAVGITQTVSVGIAFEGKQVLIKSEKLM